MQEKSLIVFTINTFFLQQLLISSQKTISSHKKTLPIIFHEFNITVPIKKKKKTFPPFIDSQLFITHD